MSINRLDKSITLHDGRKLGYAEYGPEDGAPVFYFCGGNSSRLEGKWFEQTVEQKDVRLIVPDRPGFGLSDFQPDRQLLDWPDDVIELANSISIDKFSVFGLSGGCPHVLALTFKIPNRIKKAAIASGTAPWEMPDRFGGMWPPVKLIFLTAKYMPAVNKFLLKQMGNFYSSVEGMKKRMIQSMPKPDVALFESRPEIIAIFAESTREAHLNGVDGDAQEWQLYVNPWGFKLEEIKVDVKLWYGLYDQQVPIGMGRYLASRLPKVELVEVESGGHFSTVNNHIDQIFEYLTEPDAVEKTANDL